MSRVTDRCGGGARWRCSEGDSRGGGAVDLGKQSLRVCASVVSCKIGLMGVTLLCCAMCVSMSRLLYVESELHALIACAVFVNAAVLAEDSCADPCGRARTVSRKYRRPLASRRDSSGGVEQL